MQEYIEILFPLFFYLIVVSGLIVQLLKSDITSYLRMHHYDIYKKIIENTKKSLFDTAHFQGMTERKKLAFTYLFVDKYNISKIMPIRQKIFKFFVIILIGSIGSLLFFISFLIVMSIFSPLS